MNPEKRMARDLVARYNLIAYDQHWNEIEEFRTVLLRYDELSVMLARWHRDNVAFLRTANVVPVGLQKVCSFGIEVICVEI